MQFSILFLTILVFGSLLLAGLGSISLIVLLLIDRKQKNIW